MHEWTLISQTVEEIIRQAQESKIGHVDAVALAIGEKEHITEDALKFCFDSLANGTILEKTKLKIKKTHGRGIVILSIKGNETDKRDS